MLRKPPPEHRASRAAEPLVPLEVPGRWLALAVPFGALGRNGEVWRALRHQFTLCGYSLHADGVLESRGD